MKRFFASVLACSMLLFLLTACGSAPAGQGGETTPGTQASLPAAPQGGPISDELKATDLYTRMTTAATEYDEIVSTGPHGETAVHADTLSLTEEEINQIRAGGYKAAICLHYGGNDWSTSQVAGLTDAFEILGIEIVAITDANFSVEQQVSDLETVMALNPDIIVSIPTDATATADAYRRVVDAGIKLVFMDNVPAGMNAGTPQYARLLAANERGREILRLISERSRIPVITKSASARRLPREAADCFALNAAAHDLFVLGCPAVSERRGGGDWRLTPVML